MQAPLSSLHTVKLWIGRGIALVFGVAIGWYLAERSGRHPTKRELAELAAKSRIADGSWLISNQLTLTAFGLRDLGIKVQNCSVGSSMAWTISDKGDVKINAVWGCDLAENAGEISERARSLIERRFLDFDPGGAKQSMDFAIQQIRWESPHRLDIRYSWRPAATIYQMLEAEKGISRDR